MDGLDDSSRSVETGADCWDLQCPPSPTAAAIATIERLLLNDGEVYRHVEALGAAMQSGLESLVAKLGIKSSCGTPGVGVLSLLHGPLPEGLA